MTPTQTAPLPADAIGGPGRLAARRRTSAGTHRGELATGRQVELPFIAFYNFARDGLLVFERVVMNLAPLAQAS